MSAFDNMHFQQPPKDGEPLVVVFRQPTEDELLKDEVASLAAGHPVYEEQIICEVRIPGDGNRVLGAPHDAECMVNGVKTTYAERFPREFQRYMEKMGPTVIGTPLHEAPFISASKRAELRALQVHTLEILAGLSGQPLKNLGMGGMALQAQAKEWLENARATAPNSRLAAENALIKEQIEFLRQELAAVKGGNAAVAQQIEEPEETEGNPAPLSPYEHWDDASLKQFIKTKTGEGIRGNPSRATLIARVEEVKGYDNVE